MLADRYGPGYKAKPGNKDPSLDVAKPGHRHRPGNTAKPSSRVRQ